MGNLDVLSRFFGLPAVVDSMSIIDGIQQDWQVEFDADYVRLCNSYGDLVVEDYLRIYGPKSLRERAVALGPTQEKIQSRIGRSQAAVLPSRGGALIWGSTVEGDVLYLVPEGELWRVAAFRRNWGDWYESDLGILEWLVAMLQQEICTDWMPEWPVPPLATRSMGTANPIA